MSEALVECRDLSCGYRGAPVLEQVDLTIRRGEIVTLLGGSGSGKTTLLKTIIGLLDPLAGSVELLGENIHAVRGNRRRGLLRGVGMLFQHDALLASDSIFDNIALPLRQHTALPEEIIAEVVRMKLALVGIEELQGRLPSEVSGGQRKRAALARAAVLDPQIIFFDEPTSGLDPVAAAGIEQLLCDFRDYFGIAMVAVTHELESIRRLSDRAVMLGGGRICAEGTVDELSRSESDEVRDFFARKARRRGADGPSVLERIVGDHGTGAEAG